ncbi:substrate-binding domain-containing protein [Paracoccus sp. TK19116]|uniref:Substrate-binding domain-containing protein n=1 Tax=Paracoccus albicereus TaxID=2922394 RepID=A0ABT1MMR9_9RHOB|nr:substrate-binding domain-containing protein [Paracoccus albicereus]MCQ0969577.1 substrate-binding domain-containing protein [Paracoccus albicereus]
MRKPTIIDLAKAAGVSPTTISHAFSGRRKVDPGTRDRIVALAEEMGYRPSKAAQRLRSGRTGTIGLASSMPFAVAAGPSRLGFLMEIAASAALTALTRDMALCLVPTSPDSNLDNLDFDGVIIVEPVRDEALIQYFEARHIPIVSIGKVPARPDVASIDLHSGRTARLLLDHLHEAGSRQIGLITGEQRRNSYEETEAVYATFAAEHGMTPIAMRLDENGGETLAEREAASLLTQHPQLDGLLVSVDALATGTMTALQRLGLAVPSDVRLATRYDGMRAQLSRPQLTAVDLHLDDVARAAVEAILAQMDGEDRVVAGPTPEIIIRESSRSQTGGGF